MEEQHEGINENKMESPTAHLNAVAYGEEPPAHLHSKTYLVTFAVFCIYFSQLYNLVGLGAVSHDRCCVSATENC